LPCSIDTMTGWIPLYIYRTGRSSDVMVFAKPSRNVSALRRLAKPPSGRSV
jgi:hypothetical protein